MFMSLKQVPAELLVTPAAAQVETARDSQLTATVTPTVTYSRTAAVMHPQTAHSQVMSNQPLGVEECYTVAKMIWV